jgi:hypothetical protein
LHSFLNYSELGNLPYNSSKNLSRNSLTVGAPILKLRVLRIWHSLSSIYLTSNLLCPILLITVFIRSGITSSYLVAMNMQTIPAMCNSLPVHA